MPNNSLSSEQVRELQHELNKCREDQRAARIAEEYFQIFSERVKDYAFITFDRESLISSWSRGAELIFGYLEEEILGQPGSVIFTPEDRANGEADNELSMACRNGCSEDERWHLRRNGTRFWGSGILTAHRDSGGALQGYSKVMRDQTSRKLMQERLEQSEERFRLFSENVLDYALIPVDTEGNVSGWNSGAERTFGYTVEEILGRPAAVFFTPEDRAQQASEKDLRRAVEEGYAEDSRWMIRRDSSRFWARWTTTPMYDAGGNLRGFAKVLRDETERKRTQDLIESSLQQKELLLREIHHRVKNNLNVITSLLSLQASQLEDPKLQAVLDELQDRVRAIATLHETLYGSRDLANIEFGAYMQQLLGQLFGFHAVDHERIHIRTEADDVVLSIEQALPLGLVVNELVSNSLKHAFPGGRAGTIHIKFRYLARTAGYHKEQNGGWYALSVEDDGVGIANAGGIWQGKSMGLRLVELLSNQLHGQLTLKTGSTTCFCLEFPSDEHQVTATASAAAN